MCLCGVCVGMCVRFQVQQHWLYYVEKIDSMIEEALRLNIKCSLQALSKAINGDNKTSPNPLLKVQLVLKQDETGSTEQVPKTPMHKYRVPGIFINHFKLYIFNTYILN